MYIDGKCIGCGDCKDICPQGAISLQEDSAAIDRNLCVECGVCLDSTICPQEAICESNDDYSWTKKLFGRLLDSIPGTQVKGRAGGYDVKTNDATGRIPLGSAVIRLELMRPYGGVTIEACETFKKNLEAEGFELKPLKRYELLMSRLDELPDDILKTKILTTSFETVLPTEQIGTFLQLVKRLTRAQGIWLSANLATMADSIDEMKNAVQQAGVKPRPRAKVNLGLARRTEE